MTESSGCGMGWVEQDEISALSCNAEHCRIFITTDRIGG